MSILQEGYELIRGFFVVNIVLAVLGFGHMAVAQNEDFTTSVEGGRGLMYMQSARTYGKGAFVVGFKSLVMEREMPVRLSSGAYENMTDHPTVMAVPFIMGLTDEVDLTAAFFVFNDARVLVDEHDATLGYSVPEGGFGSTRLGVKIRLPFSIDSRVQIAGKFAAQINTSANQVDGLNYRWSRTETDIEASLYESFDLTPHISFHLEQGYVLTGSDLYNDQIVGAAGFKFTFGDRFSAGLEAASRTFLGVGPLSAVQAGDDSWKYNLVNGFPAIGDPAYLRDKDADFFEDFLIVTPSASFRLNDTITVDIGANINVADQKDPAETIQGIIGITFNGWFNTMRDSDRDGVNDRIDLEPNTPRGYPVNGRGISLDTDGDGVPDGKDREKNTPLGAHVNEYGIGIDSDNDGVYDGLDMEPNTPSDCPVDRFGVAFDSDHDGVPDGIDKEPDSPVGAVVDEYGVALDSDGDGVPDGLDREADTLQGAVVDKYGIALDSDGDGVPDGLDKEPNTPRGILVDTSGRALIRQEYSLLRDGMIRLNSIMFSSGSSSIPEDSFGVLNDIGKLLRKYTTLKIQISGHTDRVGDPEVNYRLSRERALSVRDYLLTVFPDIGRDRLMAVGFGADKPIASNATAEGRRQNRRVEFVVINQEELLNINRNQ